MANRNCFPISLKDGKNVDMARRPKRQEALPETRDIPHQHASGFRAVFADGALIRPQRNDIAITFYYDDAPVKSEKMEFLRGAGSQIGMMRPLNEYEQEHCRFHEVLVRMKVEDAISLVVALVNRLNQDFPDLLQARGIEITQADSHDDS